MTTTKELEALLDRVEKAEGPYRELDADIDVSLFGGETVWVQANYTMDNHPASKRPSKHHVGGFAREHVPLVTASIDAALALVERVLPGWVWNVGGCQQEFITDKDKPMGAELHGPVSWEVKDSCVGEEPVFDSHWSTAPTAPLAILAALLKALIAQSEEGK